MGQLDEPPVGGVPLVAAPPVAAPPVAAPPVAAPPVGEPPVAAPPVAAPPVVESPIVVPPVEGMAPPDSDAPPVIAPPVASDPPLLEAPPRDGVPPVELEPPVLTQGSEAELPATFVASQLLLGAWPLQARRLPTQPATKAASRFIGNRNMFLRPSHTSPDDTLLRDNPIDVGSGKSRRKKLRNRQLATGTAHFARAAHCCGDVTASR